MKPPSQKPMRPELAAEDRSALAIGARYVGSSEHKDRRWWGGLPRARQLPGGRIGRRRKQVTSVCPLTTPEDRDRATSWIQQAIAEGNYRFVEADQRYPKNVWIEVEGRFWFGACVNTAAGHYKGWPIAKREYDEI